MMRAKKRGEQESEETETREGVRRGRAGAGESKDQQKGKERVRRQRGGGAWRAPPPWTEDSSQRNLHSFSDRLLSSKGHLRGRKFPVSNIPQIGEEPS